MIFSEIFNMSGSYPMVLPFPWWILAIIAVWTLPWKGVALWKAAKNRQLGWFVVLVIVNTLAILEIIYLVFFQKKCECCGKENHSEEKKAPVA